MEKLYNLQWVFNFMQSKLGKSEADQTLNNQNVNLGVYMNTYYFIPH